MLISLAYRHLARTLSAHTFQQVYRPLTTIFLHPFTQSRYRESGQHLDKHHNSNSEKGYKGRPYAIPLEQILRQYRESQKSDDLQSIIAFSTVCKELASQYRIEKHDQFVGFRPQLQRLLKAIPGLNFEVMELIHLLNILDFLRVIIKMETIDKQLINRARLVVFEVVSRYLESLNQLPIHEIYVFFCKLAFLNYPKFNLLASRMLELIQEELSQRKSLSFKIYEHYILIKSLSKKNYLSLTEKQIFDLVFKDMYLRRKQMDLPTKARLVKTFIDLNVPAQTAEYQLLNMVDHFFEQFAEELEEKGVSIPTFLHLSDSPPNESQHFSRIMKCMYKEAIERAAGDQTYYNFISLIQCLKHYKADFPAQHKKLVISRLKLDYFRNLSFKKKVQLQLIQLIKNGYLCSQVATLNESLVSNDQFDFYWTLVFQYSVQGLIFPAQKIVKKGQAAKRFANDKNSVKFVLGVSMQAQLQPSHQGLAALSEQIRNVVKNADWQSQDKLKWLVSLMMYYSPDIRLFHNNFGHLYLSRVQPSQQNLEKDYSSRKNERIANMPYWQYLLGVGDLSSESDFDKIWNLSGNSVTMIAMRQANKRNSLIDYKTTLLQAIDIKLMQGHIKVRKSSVVLIPLLEMYQPYLPKASDAFLTSYFKICIEIVKHYKSCTQWVQLNSILVKILNTRQPRIANSNWMIRLVNEMIYQNHGIFDKDNKYETLKMTVTRVALRFNIVKETMFSHLNQELFSPWEEKLLTSMIDHYEASASSSEQVICLFKNSATTKEKLSRHEKQISHIIKKCDLKDLQSMMVHFSLDRSQVSDRILLQMLQRLTAEINIRESSFIDIISKHHAALMSIDNATFSQFIELICEKLQQNMGVIQLVDHQLILFSLFNYSILPVSYIKKVKDHAVKDGVMSSVTIEVYYQLALYGLAQNLDWNKVEYYGIFNLNIYLKTILLLEETVPEIVTRLKKMLKYQILGLSDSIYLRYIAHKYQLSFAKQQGKHGILKTLSPLAQKLNKILMENGVNVEVSQLGVDKVYLVGEKVVLAEMSASKVKEVQFVEKALYQIYQREVLLVSSSASIVDIRQLYQLMAPHLNIENIGLEELQDDSFM